MSPRIAVCWKAERPPEFGGGFAMVVDVERVREAEAERDDAIAALRALEQSYAHAKDVAVRVATERDEALAAAGVLVDALADAWWVEAAAALERLRTLIGGDA